jgi:hypothetical protein
LCIIPALGLKLLEINKLDADLEPKNTEGGIFPKKTTALSFISKLSAVTFVPTGSVLNLFLKQASVWQF